MKEIYQFYSKCNQLINEEMFKVLENAKENVYDYPVDAFFKSIGDILDHIYKADLMWLASFKTIREFSILTDPVFQVLPDYKDRVFKSLNELKPKRIYLDTLLTKLTDEIEEGDLLKKVSRVTRSGEKMERLLWKALVHLFNHQTHHRGQISQILDQLKIENDYSNMIRYQ